MQSAPSQHRGPIWVLLSSAVLNRQAFTRRLRQRPLQCLSQECGVPVSAILIREASSGVSRSDLQRLSLQFLLSRRQFPAPPELRAPLAALQQQLADRRKLESRDQSLQS